jgi:hypothetical protein
MQACGLAPGGPGSRLIIAGWTETGANVSAHLEQNTRCRVTKSQQGHSVSLCCGLGCQDVVSTASGSGSLL